MFRYTPVGCRYLLHCLALCLAVAVAACGSGPIGPSTTAPRVSAISPNSGTTIGGTTVTITGANFTAAATVTIGGVNATQVTVINAATLTAVTGAHAAGASEVIVAVGAQRGTLPAGYTYVAPTQTANTPPVINALVAKGTKPNEPAQFADLGESIGVSAVVIDAETPVPQLTLAWSATVGSDNVGVFNGSGTNVTWTAPVAYPNTPLSVKMTLKVTERYQTTDEVGLPVTRENVVEQSRDVRLHNSTKEVSDLAYNFLAAFSQQRPVDDVMKDFTTTCSDAASERSDVTCNQQEVTITNWRVDPPQTTVPFGGRCPFDVGGVIRLPEGDACSLVPAEWTSKVNRTYCHSDLAPYIGKTMTVTGTDQVTAKLVNDQWKLCASDWNQKTGTVNFKFMR